MVKCVHLWPEELSNSGDHVTRTIRAEYMDDDRIILKKSMYFDIRGGRASDALPNHDYAVLAFLFGAMRWSRDIRVHGKISRRLLQNLEEFQLVFKAWFPKVYALVDVTADGTDERVLFDPAPKAIAAFSGGVDACFTALRHHHRRPGRYHHDVAAVMMVHGFDVPEAEVEAFATCVAGAREILAGTGLDVVTVRTNLRSFLGDWEQEFGAALAACFHNLSNVYNIGLIGSDEPYADLALPWGSNPVSNHLLSSPYMAVVTDGGGFTRTEKVASLVEWDGALNHVRVCWEGPANGKNCGTCEKCRRTILNFKAAGVEKPPAFACELTEDDILSIKLRNKVQVNYMKDILRFARTKGVERPWVSAVENLLKRHNAAA